MKNENLRSFLKKSRIKSGLSQRDVANKLGYATPQFISNWERGISEPPISIIRRLASMYYLDSDLLFRKIQIHKVISMKKSLYSEYQAYK